MLSSSKFNIEISNCGYEIRYNEIKKYVVDVYFDILKYLNDIGRYSKVTKTKKGIIKSIKSYKMHKV